MNVNGQTFTDLRFDFHKATLTRDFCIFPICARFSATRRTFVWQSTSNCNHILSRIENVTDKRMKCPFKNHPLTARTASFWSALQLEAKIPLHPCINYEVLNYSRVLIETCVASDCFSRNISVDAANARIYFCTRRWKRLSIINCRRKLHKLWLKLRWHRLRTDQRWKWNFLIYLADELTIFSLSSQEVTLATFGSLSVYKLSTKII